MAARKTKLEVLKRKVRLYVDQTEFIDGLMDTEEKYQSGALTHNERLETEWAKSKAKLDCYAKSVKIQQDKLQDHAHDLTRNKDNLRQKVREIADIDELIGRQRLREMEGHGRGAYGDPENHAHDQYENDLSRHYGAMGMGCPYIVD